MKRRIVLPFHGFMRRHCNCRSGKDISEVIPNRGQVSPIKLWRMLQLSRADVVFSMDCINMIGVLGGLIEEDVHLTWIDAHADFHTEQTTISGWLGGMPLAKMTGRGNQSLMQIAGAEPLRDDQVHLICTEMERGEREAVEASGIATGMNVKQIGALNWVHLDTDIVREWASAQMFPSVGLRRREVLDILRSLKIDLLTFSLWDGTLDPDNIVRDDFERFLRELNL